MQARRELMNRAIEEVRQRQVSVASGQPIATNEIPAAGVVQVENQMD